MVHSDQDGEQEKRTERGTSSPLEERGRRVFNSVAGHVFQIGRWRGKLRNDAIDTTIMRVIGNIQVRD